MKYRWHYLESHLTDLCNLKCAGCSHFSSLAPMDTFDEQLFFRSMRRIRELCVLEKFRLVGGEPLLNPNCERLIKENITLSLYPDKLVIDEGKDSEIIFDFDSISAITILGRNKLNVYSDNKIYQIKSHKRFNALKYINFYNRFINIKKGDTNVKFLGL